MEKGSGAPAECLMALTRGGVGSGVCGPPFDREDLLRGVESGAVVAAAVFRAADGAPDPLCSNWTLAYKVPGGNE